MSVLQDAAAAVVGAVTAATGPSSPPSSLQQPKAVDVEAQIKDLAEQIKEANSQMKALESEIHEAKRQGDKEEVAALRADKQQVSDRLKCLMEKELLLLRTSTSGGS
jgi:uncharacterized protein involved in exopolysaccharide biosynthesis